MESLLLKYGYALLFLGVAFEGEAVLLAAALLAHRGFFRLPVVIAVAVAANSLADQFYFQLARLRGRYDAAIATPDRLPPPHNLVRVRRPSVTQSTSEEKARASLLT